MNLKRQALLMTGCLASPAFAVPGFLDPTFGENGQVLVELPGPSRGWSGAQQEDGKLVIVGLTIVGTPDFAVLRLNPDGTRDTTFGVDGVATVDFNGDEDVAVEVLIQDDGKLIAAGYSWVDGYDFSVARLNSDGSIDTTFGTNGRATFNPGGFDDGAYGAVLLEDGRIVVAGVTDVRGQYDVMLVRFNVDGSLDTTFGSNGSVLIDAGAEDQAFWLVAQPDGKLIACGLTGPYAYSGFEGRMLAVRVHADGDLDATYGINGIATVDTGTDFGTALGCTMQLDGKAVLAGYTGSEPAGGPAGDLNLALARLDGDGIPDTTFGTGGQSHLDLENLGQDDIGRHVVALTDGKLGVTGAIGQLAYIARVNEDGSLDTGFSLDGVLKYGFCHCEMPSAFGWRLLEQSDGKLVATGTSFGDSPGAFAIARVNTGDDIDSRLLLSGDVTVDEAGGSVVLNVSRSGASAGAVSVNYATSSGSATANADFTSASGVLSWADGDTVAKPIRVNITNDSADENDETFTVTLSDPTGGATLGQNSAATVTITDDDSPPPLSVLSLDRTEADVGEAGGSVVFYVSQRGTFDGPLRVNYATTSGSAAAGSDFTGASGTLNWADGDTAVKTITINITNDSADESDETFTVTLSNPSTGVVLGSGASATVSIIDDDPSSPTPSPSPPPSPSSANSGGGSFGFLSLLLLAIARILRRTNGKRANQESGDVGHANPADARRQPGGSEPTIVNNSALSRISTVPSRFSEREFALR